jgi:hypothetical protein
MGLLKLRLTRKLAEELDGIDLSRAQQGELIEATEHDAALLIAEGWAVPARGAHELPRAEAADRSRRPRPKSTEEP